MRDFFRDRHLVSNPYLNFLEVFSLLLLLWIVMSEIFQVKFVLYGCISAFLISCFVIDSLRIGGLKSDRTYFILHANYLKLLIYFLWLIKEVDIYDSGVFSVHALNRKFADGLLSGDMQKRIAKLYGEEIDYRVVDVVVDPDYTVKEVVELTTKRFKRRRKKKNA